MFVSGINSFLLYSTESSIHAISLEPKETQESLAPVSKISLAASVDYYAGQFFLFFVL